MSYPAVSPAGKLFHLLVVADNEPLKAAYCDAAAELFQLRSVNRREAAIATGAVGMIREAFQAEHVLRTQQADVVVLARQLLRDPYWPLAAARQLGANVRWPVQYERARD